MVSWSRESGRVEVRPVVGIPRLRLHHLVSTAYQQTWRRHPRPSHEDLLPRAMKWAMMSRQKP